MEEMRLHGVVGLRENRMRVVVGRAESPETVVQVTEELDNALQVVMVSPAEVGDAVSYLADLFEFRLPDGLRWEKRLEQPPVVSDDPAKLRKLHVTEWIALRRWHMRETFVCFPGLLGTTYLRTPVVASEGSEFDVNKATEPDLELP